MSDNGPYAPGGGNPDPGAWQGGQGYPPAGGPNGPGPNGPGPNSPGPNGPGAGWGGQPAPGQPSGQGWSAAPGQPGGGWAQQPPPQQQPGGYGQYGPAPGQYGAPPQQPWGAPPPQGGGQGGGGSKKLLFGLIGVAVVLALIGGVVIWMRNANNTADPTPSISATSGPSTQGPGPTTQQSQAPVPTTKPSDAVVVYLRALSTGDATTALSVAATAPLGDSTFLTNAVLAKATAGKLTDVSVTEVTDPTVSTITASYKLAGKPVTATFEVTRVADQFRLSQVAATVDLSRIRQPQAPVSLAGVTSNASVIALFPGVYPVSSANRNLSYGSKKITVGDLTNQTPGGSKVTISSTGKSAILKAVKAKYSWCLKQNSLRPSGCAIWFRQPTGVQFRTSTISYRTNSGANWSNAKLKYVAPGRVEAAARTKVRFDVRSTGGRRWYGYATIFGFRADISKPKVTATFY